MRKAKGDKNYLGIAIVIFFSFIMATAVIGYIFGDNPERQAKYNDIKFIATERGWQTKYQGQTFYFSFLPQDTEKIAFPDTITLGGQPEIDVTYDFNSSQKEQIAQSIFELQNILGNGVTYIRLGFTTNTSFSLPIITCRDATSKTPVIYYRTSNQTAIKHSGNCIILESPEDGYSLLLLTDRIAYEFLGIM